MCTQAGQLAWPKWPGDAVGGHSPLCPSDPGLSLDQVPPLPGSLILGFFLCENSRVVLANSEALSSLTGVTNSVPFGREGWDTISSPTPDPPTRQLWDPQLGPRWDPE